MPANVNVKPESLMDDDEELVQYRFDPDYTMTHIGIDSLFLPTGGNLVFRMMPNYKSTNRKILGSSFTDVISLGDLVEIMSNTNPKGRLASIYRPLLVHEKNSQWLDLVSLVTNIRPFGVTSISMCKDWHKGYLTTVQPVLISGACVDDKTDYAKQDTFRIPTSLCTIIKGRVEDTRRFVFLTFKKSFYTNDWMIHFIITPHFTYINDEMMIAERMSLVYRLGIVDYANSPAGEASTYMYKPATIDGEKKTDIDTMWFVENFVFNPDSEWEVFYKESPLDFYEKYNMSNRWKILGKDPSRNAIIPFILKLMDTKHGNDDDDDDDRRRGLKRKYGDKYMNLPSSHKRTKSMIKPAKTRFYGTQKLGNLFSDRYVPKVSSFNEDNESESSVAPALQINVPTLYLAPLVQKTSLAQGTPNNQLLFEWNHKAKNNVLNPYVVSELQRSNFMSHPVSFLNNLEREVVDSNPKIYCKRLVDNDDTVTLTATEVHSILAMIFLGRLKITGYGAERLQDQLDMSRIVEKGDFEKIKCLLHYFKQCRTNKDKLLGTDRNITFSTRSLDYTDLDMQKQVGETEFEVCPSGTNIEDVKGGIFADFANKNFGGGVFGESATQEEIILLVHPEALVGRGLFAEMKKNTVCEVAGALRFNNYTGYGTGRGGYGTKTKFAYDMTKIIDYTNIQIDMGPNNRAKTRIVAFDAISYKNNRDKQYIMEDVERELLKASIAFNPLDQADKSVFVSGKWGSGEFGGDPLLKGLIQIVAANAVGREIVLVKMGEEVTKLLTHILNQAKKLQYTNQKLIHTLGKAFRGFVPVKTAPVVDNYKKLHVRLRDHMDIDAQAQQNHQQQQMEQHLDAAAQQNQALLIPTVEVSQQEQRSDENIVIPQSSSSSSSSTDENNVSLPLQIPKKTKKKEGDVNRKKQPKTETTTATTIG